MDFITNVQATHYLKHDEICKIHKFLALSLNFLKKIHNTKSDTRYNIWIIKIKSFISNFFNVVDIYQNTDSHL
jgi:hypothetical protein